MEKINVEILVLGYVVDGGFHCYAEGIDAQEESLEAQL